MRTMTMVFGLVLAVSVSPASAQVRLSVHDGHMTLTATDVTVRQVLEEWARVGNVTFANLDRVPDERVTVQVDDVPEADVLTSLLHSSSYIVVSRSMPIPGASTFERVVLTIPVKPVDDRRSVVPAPETASAPADPAASSDETSATSATSAAADSDQRGAVPTAQVLPVPAQPASVNPAQPASTNPAQPSAPDTTTDADNRPPSAAPRTAPPRTGPAPMFAPPIPPSKPGAVGPPPPTPTKRPDTGAKAGNTPGQLIVAPTAPTLPPETRPDPPNQ